MFKTTFNRLALLINQFSHLGLEKEVNNTIKILRY